MPKELCKFRQLALLLAGTQLLVASANANPSHTSSSQLQKPNPTYSPNSTFSMAHNLDRWLWNTDVSWSNHEEGLFSKTQLNDAYTPLSAEEIQKRLSIPNSYLDDFNAGFPDDMIWKPSNLVDDGEKGLGLRVATNPVSAQRPLMGGSIQFWSPLPANQASQEGRIYRYDAYLKLAPPTPGTVQAVFTYTVPWWAPRREIDFEFNGKTGRMECTIHLQPLNGSTSNGYGVSVTVPPDAFTGFRKWSIVANADRIEWFYEGKLLARYVQKLGFDTTVQEFAPMQNGAKLQAGGKYIHPQDGGWHLSKNNFLLQHWASRMHPDWIGSYTGGTTPLMRARNVDVTHFTNTNIKFNSTDWSLQPLSLTRSFSISVIRTNPANQGFVPTSLEYSLEGGAWRPLPSSKLGTQTVTNVTPGIRRIRIRPVAASINGDYRLVGDPSDEKTVVVYSLRR
ncbi:MAG: hypothetical protein CFE32_05130 [Alphaproteobacteria bacterium PA3]|nr:MAG: hypothetical protein CFE32_05130 [Alphaproteobacteria bacterium PA3]